MANGENSQVVRLLQALLQEQRRQNLDSSRRDRDDRVRGTAGAVGDRQTGQSLQPANAENGSGSRGEKSKGVFANAPSGSSALISVISQLKGVIQSGFQTYSSSIGAAGANESDAVVKARAEAQAQATAGATLLRTLGGLSLGSNPFLSAQAFEEAGQVERRFKKNTQEADASQQAAQTLQSRIGDIAAATGVVIGRDQLRDSYDILKRQQELRYQQEREVYAVAERDQLEVYNRPEVNRMKSLFR